jgi:hypothetical protein
VLAEPVIAPRSAVTNRRWVGTFVLLWFVPLAGALWFIARFGVDVPYWDELTTDISQFLVRAVTHQGISWADLVAQHNESRKVFPRLLFLAVAHWAHWDQRWEMAASAVTVFVAATGILWISLRTIRNQNAALLAALLANFLLFTPVQWVNFLWGIQWVVFAPTAALVLIVAVLSSDLNIWLATAISAALATVATYSYANGMLVWVLAIPMLWLYPSRSKKAALAVWLALVAIEIGYYFHGYQKPTKHPSFLVMLHEPAAAIQFVLGFLGNGLRPNGDLMSNIALGTSALALWAAVVCGLVLARRRGQDLHGAQSSVLLRRSMPWILLGVYTIASAVIAMAGRLGFGVIWGIELRYTTFAAPLWTSLVPLCMLLYQAWWPEPERGASTAKAVRGLICALAICIVATAVYGVVRTWEGMEEFSSERRAARVLAQFSTTVPEDSDVTSNLLFPSYTQTMERLAELGRAGLLHAGVVSSTRLIDLPGGEGSMRGGAFEELHRVGDQIVVRGWAFDPDRREPADAILLTAPDAAGNDRVFAIVTDDRQFRPDVAEAEHHNELLRTGWSKTFSASRLPPGAVVSAWAYDSEKMRAYRLGGTYGTTGGR